MTVAYTSNLTIKKHAGAHRTAHLKTFEFKAPQDLLEKAHRALEVYADMCPAYQSVKDCIACSWEADIT